MFKINSDKKTIFLALLLWFTSLPASSKGNESIIELAQRLLPRQHQYFEFSILPHTTKEIFVLESKGNKIIIKGSTDIAIAVGLNHYLKYYCNTSVSWYADDVVELPNRLPIVPKKITRQARCTNRFFLNYCTFGYTMPWWQWKDWERLIDWMALNGINMPLAITGQEAIWYKVWKKLGLTDTEIRNYFTGPAHLPWHRMSNLDHWQNPLPTSWLDNQLVLQKKIVAREKEMGMTPILPAFAGHVPEVLKKHFPKAKISPLGEWGGFEDKYRSFFLDPFDSLFSEIQKNFLQEQSKAYGTSHIYGADPFNEVVPPSWDTAYLASVSRTIYQTIQQEDKTASWLQMTWLFYIDSASWNKERIKNFVHAVPQDKMILLDYFCENTEVWKRTASYFGQPFIWCYLGNFGGNTMLAGNIEEVEKRMENVFSNAGANLWGIGSTLEGFDVNPLMYEYVFEKAWSSGAVDVNTWMMKWADRRYGKPDESSRRGWRTLLDKIYKFPAKCTEATLTNARPTLTGSGNWTTNNEIGYRNINLLDAWEQLLKNSDKAKKIYGYDIVNIGRQVLGNYFTVLRDQFTKSYRQKDIVNMNRIAAVMMELLDDMDKLLSTQSSFLLGKWIADARRLGIDNKEKNYYEQNARTLVTTWGATAQSLNDYGNRTWAGLLKGYYRPRWQMFINDAIAAVAGGKDFDEKAFFEKVTAFEWNWTMQQEKYNSKPIGNAISIGLGLYSKYVTQIRTNSK